MKTRWSCFVTSAPRPESTLQATLDSLAGAGWTEPLVVYDAQQRGPWQSFLSACRLGATDDVDAVLISQDDVEYCRGIRGWLDEHLWPEPLQNVGLVSLWLPAVYPNSHSWWYRDLCVSVSGCYGALAYVLPIDVVRTIARLQYRRTQTSKTDITMGRFCRDHSLTYWWPPVSFCQHTGTRSAINPDNDERHTKYRFARDSWPRDVKLLECLLSMTQSGS